LRNGMLSSPQCGLGEVEFGWSDQIDWVAMLSSPQNGLVDWRTLAQRLCLRVAMLSSPQNGLGAEVNGMEIMAWRESQCCLRRRMD